MLTRRQFLSYTAVLGAASAFSWQTYKYLNRKPPVSINRVGLPLGHLLRDGELLSSPTRRYECNTLILGGGAAGLGALWYLAKHNHRDVLLAEGFERNGNNAAYTSSDGLKSAERCALFGFAVERKRVCARDVGGFRYFAVGWQL